MTEQQARQKLVLAFKGWIGYSETNGKHREIIDLYNTQKPLPRGYRVKYSDEWCATAVTAAGMKAELSRIILGECSCSRMIELYKKTGRWQEKDSYVPSIGDIVMYDWQDGSNYATTDNTGTPDHVGVVASINGNTITIIEGNKGGEVAYRNLNVNGRYIRGWCLPDYSGITTEKGDEDDMEKRYQYLKDVPIAYYDSVEKILKKGFLSGYSNPNPNSVEDNLLNISDTFCRIIKVMDNAGVFD